MKRGETKTLTTLRVNSASVAARPDGSIALVLGTLEGESIAFEVTLEAIGALRRNLDDAEAFLSRGHGNA